jgi:hypothetical protein
MPYHLPPPRTLPNQGGQIGLPLDCPFCRSGAPAVAQEDRADEIPRIFNVFDLGMPPNSSDSPAAFLPAMPPWYFDAVQIP